MRSAWGVGIIWIVSAVLVASLAACSAKDRSETVATEPTATVAATWSLKSDCSKCHEAEVASFKDDSMLASQHASHACSDCHSDEAALKQIHNNALEAGTTTGSVSSGEAEPIGTSEFCLKCHGSYEELAVRTGDSIALKDAKGTIVNPHAVPEEPDHKADADQCYNCHTIHAAPDRVGYCFKCHHKNVFECGTCHPR